MKKEAAEWTWAALIGLVTAGVFYGVGWAIDGKDIPDWGDVFLAATIAYQSGRKWERE